MRVRGSATPPPTKQASTTRRSSRGGAAPDPLDGVLGGVACRPRAGRVRATGVDAVPCEVRRRACVHALAVDRAALPGLSARSQRHAHTRSRQGVGRLAHVLAWRPSGRRSVMQRAVQRSATLGCGCAQYAKGRNGQNGHGHCHWGANSGQTGLMPYDKHTITYTIQLYKSYSLGLGPCNVRVSA